MSIAQSTGFRLSLRAADPSATGRLRSRAILDIVLAYGLILATIWSPRPFQQWIYLLAAAWIVVSTARSFPGWNALGFRTGGFWRSSWVIAAAILFAALATAAATRLHTLRQPVSGRSWIMTFGGYVVWSFAQQFLLQSYFLHRFRQLIPSQTKAALAAAGIFAAAHLPNPILVPVTLIWGLCACFVFLRHRNLYPLAVTHAILGICVAVTVPGPLIHNMRVGLGYVRYHHRTAPPLAPPTAPASLFTRLQHFWS
ncbi:CPBP family intramembrane metalloprotease [Acidobacteria bacterium AB60]|nr:CPBP family intramembrane metalloprotease [Acidobacteria bacterium AB60]